MTLHVSNPTPLNYDFGVRVPIPDVPERSGLLFNIRVPREGGSVVVGQDWSPVQQRAVIDQLRRRGARDAAEVHGKIRGFNGLLYRDMGYPVREDELVLANEQVMESMTERSAQQATRNALALDRVVNTGQRGTPRRKARMTGVEVMRERAPGELARPDDVEFSIDVDAVHGRSDVELPV